MVAHGLKVKKIHLRDLQSMLGKMNFACSIIPNGRLFYLWLAMAAAGVKRQSFCSTLGPFEGGIREWNAGQTIGEREMFGCHSIDISTP